MRVPTGLVEIFWHPSWGGASVSFIPNVTTRHMTSNAVKEEASDEQRSRRGGIRRTT